MLGWVPAVFGITLAELQLHPWRRPLTHSDEAVRFVRAHYAADLNSVDIVASDGIELRALYVRPHDANGRDVLLLPASPTIAKAWQDSPPCCLIMATVFCFPIRALTGKVVVS